MLRVASWRTVAAMIRARAEADELQPLSARDPVLRLAPHLPSDRGQRVVVEAAGTGEGAARPSIRSRRASTKRAATPAHENSRAV